jgi:hypothetical protein
VALEVLIVHAAVDKNIRNRVTDGFADPQLTLRAAGGGTFAVVARHCRFLKMVTPALVAGIQVFSLNQVRRGWPGQARP